MMQRLWGAAAAAVLIIGVQPCAAATQRYDSAVAARPAAFAGGTIRLSLGKADARPEARMQLGIRQTGGLVDAAPSRLRGLELGVRSNGKTAIFMNGIEVGDVQQRAGVKGSTGTYLLIGAGVLLLGFVVAYASASAEVFDFCDDQPECTD